MNKKTGLILVVMLLVAFSFGFILPKAFNGDYQETETKEGNTFASAELRVEVLAEESLEGKGSAENG